jgi:hypothetical protein
MDTSTERVKSRVININEVLEFDHLPTGEEIQSAISRLPKFETCRVQFLETLAIQKLSD